MNVYKWRPTRRRIFCQKRKWRREWRTKERKQIQVVSRVKEREENSGCSREKKPGNDYSGIFNERRTVGTRRGVEVNGKWLNAVDSRMEVNGRTQRTDRRRSMVGRSGRSDGGQ